MRQLTISPCSLSAYRRVRVAAIAALSLMGLAVHAHASPVTLDFDGFVDTEGLFQYYDGGFGSKGSGPGPDYGITAGFGAVVGVDNDATGLSSPAGDTANEPSGQGTFHWSTLVSNHGVIQVTDGFTGTFSVMYSGTQPATLHMRAGIAGSGAILGTIDLPAFAQTLPGDPTGTYTTWRSVSVSLTGVAHSVEYLGQPFAVRFDDMTFDLVPAPGSLALLTLAPLAVVRRRR